MSNKVVKLERRLLALFERTSNAGRDMLLEYAEFIAQRHERPHSSLVPLDIPRPESETVVVAIKRLTETFPMLESTKLLGETSGLMAQHVVHRRAAVEVIGELEALFRRHYALHVGRRNTTETTPDS